MALTLLESIKLEEEANARARLEGYESAAHKEAHANKIREDLGLTTDAAQYQRDADARAAQVIDPRTGKGFLSASDMEVYNNEQSRKVFNPATGKMFTSAADYEIDANRRAREAGYLNAADYESGLRTRVDPLKFPFVDPRDVEPAPIPEPYRIGTANLLKYNPDQPDHPDYDPNWRDNYPGGFDFHGNPITGGTVLGPGVGEIISQQPYTQAAPLNWQYILPTQSYSPEFSALALNPGNWQPWATGQSTPSGLINYQIPGGDPANVTYTGGNPNLFNTNTDGTTFSGGTNTDAQGNKWIMSNGQWIRADSDLGSILSAGDTPRFPLGHYDSNGMWIGAEAQSGAGTRPGTWGGDPNLAAVAGSALGPNPTYGANPNLGITAYGTTDTLENAIAATKSAAAALGAQLEE